MPLSLCAVTFQLVNAADEKQTWRIGAQCVITDEKGFSFVLRPLPMIFTGVKGMADIAVI